MAMLSPTMTYGTITKWHVPLNGHVEVGELIYEVRAEKLTEVGDTLDMVVEAQDDGYIAAVFAPVGSRVLVGAPLAVLCDEEKDVAQFEGFTPPAEVEQSEFAYWAYVKNQEDAAQCSVSSGAV
jgi:pyruvate/2-oxoglutarate dehydrogenase complex dihydrolipoamide acyltransferase (E2) component